MLTCVRSRSCVQLEILPNMTNHTNNIVVLDQSGFYPTSGGQEHDTGTMTINGTLYKVSSSGCGLSHYGCQLQVVDVEKVGPAVLHFLDNPVPVKKVRMKEHCSE